MICPTCGNNVSNDKPVCPLCGTELLETQAIPRFSGTWCKSCGALIPADVELCPKCHRPVDGSEPAKHFTRRDIALPDIDKESEDIQARTASRSMSNAHDISQFESAIPSYNEIEETSLTEGAMKPRKVLAVALAAVVGLSALALAVTQPWSPLSPKTAVEGADLSDVGSLEPVSSLQGQDLKRRNDDTGTPSVFDLLLSSYEDLAAMKDRLIACEQTYDELCLTGTAEERASAAHDVELLAIELSNLISQVGQMGGHNSELSQDIDHVVTLGNWLRNRVDALRAAWAYDMTLENPEDEADAVRDYLVRTGSSEYMRLFESHYEEWKPQS